MNVKYTSLQAPGKKITKFGAAAKPNQVKHVLHNVHVPSMCVCVRPDLVVSPAGLPHAQGLSVGELAFEAQQDPAVTEEQLQAVLPQPSEVLVEPGQHDT